MGPVLTLVTEHPVISSLGIVLTTVSAWGAGYLRGFRHGEEAEVDRKYSQMLKVEKNNDRLRDRIDFLAAENDQLRKQIRLKPLFTSKPPKPDNQKETGGWIP